MTITRSASGLTTDTAAIEKPITRWRIMMTNNILWTEKYKPVSLDQCALDGFPKHIQTLLKASAALRIPLNLLLVGPTGAGKSQIAGLLQDKEKHFVRWMHGSKFTVREVEQLHLMSKQYRSGCQRLLVLIDDADHIPKSTQQLLCSYIEPEIPFSWIMTGTASKNIIEPIKSRLIEIGLPAQKDRQLHLKGVVQRCRQILLLEQVNNVSDDEIYKIADERYPDIRQTINKLQALYWTG